MRQIRTVRQINPTGRLTERESLRRKAAALFSVLGSLDGQEALLKRAQRMGARALLGSRQLGRRVLALQRLVYEDATLNTIPREPEIPAVLEDLQERIADLMARKSVQAELERRVQDRMKERQGGEPRARGGPGAQASAGP